MAAFAPGGAASDRSVMAGIASRLMGGGPSPVSLSHSSLMTFPRASTAAAPPFTFTGNSAAFAPTSVKQENIPPMRAPFAAKTPSVSSSLPDMDTNMADANDTPAPYAGPSLFGTAEQLAEARAMNASMTKGGSKGSSGRKRLMSKRSSDSSSPNSPRSSIASLNSGSGGIARPIRSPRAASSRSERMSMAMPTPVTASPRVSCAMPPPAQNWNSFAVKPTTSRVETVAAPPAPAVPAAPAASVTVKVTSSPAQPSSTSPEKKQRTATWQLTDVTNTLNQIAPSASNHRTSHASDEAVTVSETKTTTIELPEPSLKAVDSPMLAHTGFGAIGSKVVSIALTPSDDAEKVKAEPIQTEVKILAPQQTVSAISPTPVVSTPLPATEEFDGEVHAIELIAPDLVASLEGKNVKKIVEAILDNLIKVNKHIDELKEENSILQKKVEDLVQSDERRKFLGTDSAKEPFGIFVKCGDEVEPYRIQVHAELKVGDLVRRIRTRVSLSAEVTKEPRISVNGKQVGHAQYLGEVGVIKGKDVEVAFSFKTDS